MAYRMIESESGMHERVGAKKIIKGIYAMLDELCEAMEEEGMHERGGMYERDDEYMRERRMRDSRGRYM